jgi:hypothetical protein
MSPGATHLRLEVIGGNASGSTIVVDVERVIGRHATGAGRLSEDEELSRQHARISREATGDYAIEDLGSSNGTFVNGLRIQTPRLLAPGDSIETGTTTLVVREIVRPEPAPAPPDVPPASDRYAPTVFGRSPVVQQTQTTATSAQEARPAADPVAPVEPAPSSTPSQPAPPPSPASPASPPPPEQPTGPTTPLALRLDVDFDAREARIALGDGGETVRMVFVDGVWRTSN